MSRSVFYWECLGQSYPFDPSKTYLIYFKGCYCPPTRGHFDTVKRFIDLGPNIHVMIHQIGSSRRHGVPYHLNQEIWETYIDKLLPPDRVHLIRYNSNEDILDMDIINSIDTVIYLRGNEDYDIHHTEKSNRERFRSIIRRLNRRGVKMDFYYVQRPDVRQLSATKFTRTLIRTKKRCRRKGCSCKYKKLKFFMPTDLPEETTMRLVRKMQSYHLTV